MPVEDELVLAADEVAEGEVRARVACARDEHLLALLGLPDVERRRREVDDELRAGECEIGRGRAGLPDVLADRDADGRVAEPEEDEVATLGEVAVLVEDAVVREEVLAVDGLHAAVRADGAGVREIAVEPGRADERDDAVGRGRDLLERLVRGAHEPGPKEEILGRIAGRRELGEDDEVGAGGCAPRRGSRGSSSRLPSRSPTTAFELRERDSQGFRLTVTNRV